MGSSFETISCQGKENFRVINQLAFTSSSSVAAGLAGVI